MLPTRAVPGSTPLRPSFAPSAMPSTPSAPAQGSFGSPQQRVDAALLGIVAGCRHGRCDIVSQGARAALDDVDCAAPQGTLLRQLSQLQAADAPIISEQKLWLLRRLNGTPIGLYRLRANGEVGLYPHPNESAWSLADGTLRLQAPNGRTTTEFSIYGQHEGRQVFVGLFRDGTTVHVLSEVNCYYSKLRALDPELIGALATAMHDEPMPDFGMPEVPAVVLAAPRTGSHLLLNLLNSTGEVFFDAELFNFEKISVFGADLPGQDTRALSALRAADPVQFAKVMMARSHHVDGRTLDGIGVRGFKLFPEQSPAMMSWLMDESRVRIVHLHRPNLLAEFSSLIVASQHGHWVGGPEALKQHRIHFDANRFARFVEFKRAGMEVLRARLAQRAGPHIEIAYGAFTPQSLNAVLSFLLDRPSHAHFSHLGLKRQLNEQIIERFDNPDAVMSALASMGAEAWAGSETPDVAGL